MPRLIAETKHFDYKTETEMNNHLSAMADRGWICRRHYETDDSRWHYSAEFERGILVNGVKGNGKY